MTARAQQIDGEYWFTAKYAATLLATTRTKVEGMAVRGLIRSIPDGNSFLIAEADVTALRRDENALEVAKEAERLPKYPRKGERMPRETKYKDDPLAGTFTGKGPVGNPLADPRKR